MVARQMQGFLMAPLGVPLTLKSDNHVPEKLTRAQATLPWVTDVATI